MKRRLKKGASTQSYVSQNQLILTGFKTLFSQGLDSSNRWVSLADKIPWDDLANLYLNKNTTKSTGRLALNSRIVVGSLIIKHLCNLDDRETVAQITKNMYMQYFLGYSVFCKEPPFDPSLFVEMRRRIGDELVAQINDRILEMYRARKKPNSKESKKGNGQDILPSHQRELLMDATVAPQNIAYRTDLNLLNESRENNENIIDYLHNLGSKKARTCRKNGRKESLSVAQNRNPSRKNIRKVIGKQIGYLKRNFNHLNAMLDNYESIPLPTKLLKQYWVIQVLYDQQVEMYENRTHTFKDRIVSIHQPHVCPIVCGKARSKVEFGAKIHISLINGYAFLDTISWDGYNEGTHLKEYVETYKDRFGLLPSQSIGRQTVLSAQKQKMAQRKRD